MTNYRNEDDDWDNFNWDDDDQTSIKEEIKAEPVSSKQPEQKIRTPKKVPKVATNSDDYDENYKSPKGNDKLTGLLSKLMKAKGFTKNQVEDAIANFVNKKDLREDGVYQGYIKSIKFDETNDRVKIVFHINDFMENEAVSDTEEAISILCLESFNLFKTEWDPIKKQSIPVLEEGLPVFNIKTYENFYKIFKPFIGKIFSTEEKAEKLLQCLAFASQNTNPFSNQDPELFEKTAQLIEVFNKLINKKVKFDITKSSFTFKSVDKTTGIETEKVAVKLFYSVI